MTLVVAVSTFDGFAREVVRDGVPGPIQGDAARLALTHAVATETRDGRERRPLRLDEEELQALERAEYHAGADPVPASVSPNEGFPRRLWHRLRRSG